MVLNVFRLSQPDSAAPFPAETIESLLRGELDALVEIRKGQRSLDFRQRDNGIQPAVALDGESCLCFVSLISALAAKCEVLLILDQGDFGILLGTKVYRVRVGTPRYFLIGEGLG